MVMGARGFSLIELLIALVVAAVLTAIAAPYFRDLYLNNQISSATNNLVQAAYAARIEAIKRTEQIRVSSDKTNGVDASDEWGPGLVVYLDVNTDLDFDLGTDVEVMFVAAAQGNQTIDEPGNITDFNFLPSGRTDAGVAVELMICDGRLEKEERRVSITQRGLIKTLRYKDIYKPYNPEGDDPPDYPCD